MYGKELVCAKMFFAEHIYEGKVLVFSVQREENLCRSVNSM